MTVPCSTHLSKALGDEFPEHLIGTERWASVGQVLVVRWPGDRYKSVGTSMGTKLCIQKCGYKIGGTSMGCLLYTSDAADER